MPSFLPHENIILEEKTIGVPITAFDDAALLLAACISMSNIMRLPLRLPCALHLQYSIGLVLLLPV